MIYANYLRADMQQALDNGFCYMRSSVVAIEARGFTRYYGTLKSSYWCIYFIRTHVARGMAGAVSAALDGIG